MPSRDELRAAWRSHGWYRQDTIAEALAHAAALRPDEPLMFAPVDRCEERVRLADLYERALRTAGGLWDRGVRPRQHVLLQAPADVRGTELLLALWLLDAIVVPMVLTATPDEISYAIRDTTANTAIVAPEWRGTSLAGQMDEVGISKVISTHDHLVEASFPDSVQSPASVDACVLYTSGSSAAPKGVRHSHETLMCGMASGSGTGSTLATFPPGHVASLLGLMRPLVAGGATIVMDRWSARHAATLIEEHQITTTAGTPFFLTTLLDEAERSGRDIGSLERFLCGAAAVPPALVDRAESAGILTWRSYGLTEQPMIASGTPLDPPSKRRETDGRVTPGAEVRIVERDGTEAGPGSEGEILARGPRQFLGYQDPVLDNDAFAIDGWLRTGDLGRLDADGYLVVTDRVKDIIIRGGENISAREVEDVLAGHPAVREVAVCAAPDSVFGEAVGVFVIPIDGAEPSLSELVDYATAAGLAPHKRPSRLSVVADFPRTAAGKARKRELRELWT